MLYHPPTIERPTAVRLSLEEGESTPLEPLTVEAIKQELRIPLPDEDARVESLAVSAREWIEQHYRLALIPGIHRCVVPATTRGRLDLPITPVTEVLSVARRGADGEDEALATTAWWADLDYRPARVWVPGCGVYVVTCATGWTTETIPGPVKDALTYRVWGFFDGVKTDDWLRVVRTALQPYRAGGL